MPMLSHCTKASFNMASRSLSSPFRTVIYTACKTGAGGTNITQLTTHIARPNSLPVVATPAAATYVALNFRYRAQPHADFDTLRQRLVERGIRRETLATRIGIARNSWRGYNERKGRTSKEFIKIKQRGARRACANLLCISDRAPRSECGGIRGRSCIRS